ncbi:MAG: amidohydrolase family protein [Luteitalea sp.]|nr:amidohydrolase family protein [Luteitalea sp.]
MPRPRSANGFLTIGALVALAVSSSAVAIGQQQRADLILFGARVWTGDPDRPWAEAVAIQGNKIVAVDGQEVFRHRGPETRVLHLNGRFIAPGFIDSHTHFDRAGRLLLGVNLLDVGDEARLVERVREARDRLPKGAWLLDGDWGAYDAWGKGSVGRGSPRQEREGGFRPDRFAIDPITPDTPVLLSKWDKSIFLANARALALAKASCEWDGVECDAEGQMTGRLAPEAAKRVRDAGSSPSLQQRLDEARAALAELRSFGVTTIHDNTSRAALQVFRWLRSSEELTVRVYARPTLDQWYEESQKGEKLGRGDDWIRFGGLKGFVDGIMGNSTARFYEPYETTGERGTWRPMMEPRDRMFSLLLAADASGLSPQVHAIGDEAIDVLLDLYERVARTNGSKPRRFRVIHAQVLRDAKVAARMARLGVIAEVQPYHAIDDMRWMEERIGRRARGAYAFRTLKDAGVRLSFGSDWPGTNASWYSVNPLHGIYAAVTRQTLDGNPRGGWFPQERIDVETALRAYTVNNAWAAAEEAVKGSITPGKLADLVVLDRNPFEVEPAEIKDINVLYTVLDGRIVHERGK